VEEGGDDDDNEDVGEGSDGERVEEYFFDRFGGRHGVVPLKPNDDCKLANADA